MRRLLLVQPDEFDAAEYRRAFDLRQDELELEVVPSIDHARRVLRESRPVDGVLLCPGLKGLSLASFATAANALARRPRLMLIDEEVAGYTPLRGSPGRVVDQALALLGILRSTTADAPALELLGFSGHVQFERVSWPGSPEPLHRAMVARRDFREADFEAAQRAAQLSGPGLATTIEQFWDDPRPHLLQSVPPGLSLERLRLQRREWGIDFGMSVIRGIADALVTLHAAGSSGGGLRPPSVWLTDEGEVLLLGQGLVQLPLNLSPYYGSFSDAPPEEYGQSIAPHVPGDPFRLGVLAMELAVNELPIGHMRPVDYLERNWEPVLDPWAERFGSTVSRTLEILLQPSEVDRPRGELLRRLLDEASPGNWTGVIRDAVAWSRAAPARTW